MNKSDIEHYWYAFLASLPANSTYFGKTYVAEGFGDNPKLADELGQLIVSGKKTGTCSALWEWEAEGNPIPAAGLISIVLDGHRSAASALLKQPKYSFAASMQWMKNSRTPKAKVICPSNTGAKLTKISSRVSFQRLARNSAKICRWSANASNSFTNNAPPLKYPARPPRRVSCRSGRLFNSMAHRTRRSAAFLRSLPHARRRSCPISRPL